MLGDQLKKLNLFSLTNINPDFSPTRWLHSKLSKSHYLSSRKTSKTSCPPSSTTLSEAPAPLRPSRGPRASRSRVSGISSTARWSRIPVVTIDESGEMFYGEYWSETGTCLQISRTWCLVSLACLILLTQETLCIKHYHLKNTFAS